MTGNVSQLAQQCSSGASKYSQCICWKAAANQIKTMHLPTLLVNSGQQVMRNLKALGGKITRCDRLSSTANALGELSPEGVSAS